MFAQLISHPSTWYGIGAALVCVLCIRSRSVQLSSASFVLLVGWSVANFLFYGLRPPRLIEANAALDLCLMVASALALGDLHRSKGWPILQRLSWTLASPKHRVVRYLILLSYVTQLSLHFGSITINLKQYGVYYFYDNMLFIAQLMVYACAGGRRVYVDRRNHNGSAPPIGRPVRVVGRK